MLSRLVLVLLGWVFLPTSASADRKIPGQILFQVRINDAREQNRSVLMLLICCFTVLMLRSHLSMADIIFVPAIDTYAGSVVDSSSCTNPSQTIQFEYSTLDEVLQLYLRTKVSASNCSTNQVWFYDYERTDQIGTSSWEFFGRSQYDGSIASIGSISVRHDCPGQPNVGSSICPIACPSDLLMINGQCQQPKMTNSSCVGNPVVTATGNKVQVETDYLSKAENGITFKRIYNSLRVASSNNADYIWRHNYDHKVLTAQTIGGQTMYIANRTNSNYQEFIVTSNGLIPRDVDITGRLDELKNEIGVRTGWQYTTADNDVEIYDINGRLLSITYHDGQSQTLTYSDETTAIEIAPMAGLLIRVTDAYSRQLNFTYNSGKQIATITDPSGGLYSYGYDIANNLTSVTYPDLKTRTYLYNEQIYTQGANLPNALTGIIDEIGLRYATFQYDASGKAISTEHAGGVEKYSLVYSADGSSTTVTDPLGSSQTTNFTTFLGVVKPTDNSQPAGAGCAASASHITYDANGNIASRTDFNGNLSCYAYDLSRNLETVRVEGLPAGSACPANLASYTPPGGSSIRKIATQWHADYRLPTQIDETGRRTTFGYDSHGNLLAHTVIDTATGQSRTWSYTYNNLGQVLTADGPRTDVNDITSYTYYADATADHKPGDLATIVNALGHVTTFNSYDANGRPLTMTEPNGLVTNLAYDPRGRLTHISVGQNTTTYDYDPAGNLIKVTDPSGDYLSHTYDAAHRLVRTDDNLGNHAVYTLDAMGNRLDTELFDPQGQLARSQSRVYDALSRLQDLIQRH